MPLGTLDGSTLPQNVGPFDNRVAGCTTWQIVYNSTGFSALSLVVQTAPNNGGVPGSWSTFTAVTGVNPNTATTENVSTFGGITSYFPWLRVQLTSKTGTGSISGQLFGWRTGSQPGGGTGPGTPCAGTAASPCIVAGPDPATGVPPTKNPVQIAGNSSEAGGVVEFNPDINGNFRVVGTGDVGFSSGGAPVQIGGQDASGHIQAIASDSAGRITPSTASFAQSDGNTNSPTTWNDPTGGPNTEIRQMVYPFKFNSGNSSQWDRDFICGNQVRAHITTSGDTQIIAASGSTNIRICHMHFSTTPAENVTIDTGTGVNCGTGTATIDSYINVVAAANDFSPAAALRGGASNAVCVNPAANQAIDVVVIFAQF